MPLIADSVKNIPIMAAGGITDNRTAKAAHALGAEGVFAGSVFIGTEESRVPQSVKDKIIEANGLDLLLFRTLPDYYRSLPGKLAEKALLRWTKQAQVMKSWVKQWGGYLACVSACLREIQMKATSRSVRE